MTLEESLVAFDEQRTVWLLATQYAGSLDPALLAVTIAAATGIAMERVAAYLAGHAGELVPFVEVKA